MTRGAGLSAKGAGLISWGEIRFFMGRVGSEGCRYRFFGFETWLNFLLVGL